MTYRIFIVDDHPMVREGMALRIGLEPDLEVCGEAASEAEALAGIAQAQPDLVLIDISLKSGHGLELIKQIVARNTHTKMLVVSAHDESLYGERCLRAGAHGYVNKQESNDKMIEGIRTVLRGERFVSAEMTRRLVAQALGGSADAKSPIESLSDRELEVFRMIGQGLTSGAIATALHVSPHTIDTHRENIKRKLALRSAAELTRAAVQWVLQDG